MELKDGMEVFTVSSDHSLRRGYLTKELVAYIPESDEYFEYFGEEHLEEWEIAVERWVVR
jgi:hypothetical protein